MAYTNNSIKPAMERFPNLLKESDKCPDFQKVDKIGILAFNGLLYLCTAFRLNLRETIEISNHESPLDIFSATMSYIRFQFIHKFVTFDGRSPRNDRWEMDKFACLRELFKLMNDQNAKCRFPPPLLCSWWNATSIPWSDWLQGIQPKKT